MINTEIASKVLEQILTHPETHDQNIFEDECGTVRCVAGWAIFFAHNRKVADVARSVHDVCFFGANALGIDLGQARNLFYEYDNTQAVGLLKEIANGNENWADSAQED